MASKAAKTDGFSVGGFDAVSLLFLIAGVIFLILSIESLWALPTSMATVANVLSTGFNTSSLPNNSLSGSSLVAITQTALVITIALGFVVGLVEVAMGLAYSRFAPERRRTWSIIGLVFGIIGIFSAGNFVFITPALCIIAGVLGILRNK